MAAGICVVGVSTREGRGDEVRDGVGEGTATI